MNILLLILFDLFVLWFFFGQTLQRWLSPPSWRLKMRLREIERHFRHLLRRDRDILAPELTTDLQAAADGLRVVRKGRQTGEYENALAGQPAFAGFLDQVGKDGYGVAVRGLVDAFEGGKVGPVVPPRKRLWLRDHLEVAVVALGLAFGVRALFLQPFKIPTGSMQPTLYGIHFVHSETGPPKFGPVGRFFGYLHYSRRYVDLTVQQSGWLDVENIREVPVPIPLEDWLLPQSSVNIGSVPYVLPGSPDVVRKYLRDVCVTRSRTMEDPLHFEQGELFLRGYLELGDHLFVDRTYLPFHEPERGDVTVFRTDHIRHMNGSRLNGPYYIKRLVGMPGDELRIRHDHVEVRRPGEWDFRPLTAKDNPGFGRIYSGKGGYRGHTHLGGFCLTDDDDIFYIPRKGDLLKIDVQTLDCWIQKVDSDHFVPYRQGHVGMPIMAQGVPETLAWLNACGWFERVEENVYRFRYDHFLMLGDNTENSSDGRAWGTIPRANLVGRASFVWWPFTRRWGRADRLPPLDYPSPPTPFDLPPLGADANE
jgi:signal peptidase I